MRYVVVAEGRVIYCGSKAEALQVAYESSGRAFRADWSEISDGPDDRPADGR